MPVSDSGRGRPTLYCSRSCKSKVARAKTAALAEAGRAAQRQPSPSLEGARAALLGHAARLESIAHAVLAAVDADPATAYEEFYQQALLLDARVRQTAADARDEVRSPGITKDECELRRAEEDLMRPELLARVAPEILASADRAANPPAAGTADRHSGTAQPADDVVAPGFGTPTTTARPGRSP
ncbi:hypothetical protein ACFU7Y_30855 [Kitasatospora sp. NPDC057542]|uniref:hypothetical protein n=1 Tax=Streptomycetaceae TaxID=2062 RepID=UPI001CC92749|nr:hypothetical protein [Streptomyces sp. LS1784]